MKSVEEICEVTHEIKNRTFDVKRRLGMVLERLGCPGECPCSDNPKLDCEGLLGEIGEAQTTIHDTLSQVNEFLDVLEGAVGFLNVPCEAKASQPVRG